MLKVLVVALIFTSAVAQAHKKEHKSHVHGAAQIAIAFDGPKGEVTIEGSGDAFVGFEHKPKNIKQEKIHDEALEKLKTKVAEMIIFPAAAECTWATQKSEVEYHGNHSDFKSIYSVACKSAPAGTVEFKFTNVFPRLKNAKVEILTEKLQKTLDVKNTGASIEF